MAERCPEACCEDCWLNDCQLWRDTHAPTPEEIRAALAEFTDDGTVPASTTEKENQDDGR
jgi:hypothetical protein